MKSKMLPLLNSLFAGIVTTAILNRFVVNGLMIETVFVALMGGLVGAIIAVRSPTDKVWIWLGVSIATTVGLLSYDFLIWSLNGIDFLQVALLLSLLLISLIGFFYIFAYFQLKIMALFKNGGEEEATTPTKSD